MFFLRDHRSCIQHIYKTWEEGKSEGDAGLGHPPSHITLPSSHSQPTADRLALPCPHPSLPAAAHLVPLVAQLIHGNSAVGVAGADPDAVALDHLLHLVLDGQDGLPLPVGLGQRGLELLMRSDQTLQGAVQRTNPSRASTVCLFLGTVSSSQTGLELAM